MTEIEKHIAEDIIRMVKNEAQESGLKESWIFGFTTGSTNDRNQEEKKKATRKRYKIISELKDEGYPTKVIAKAFGITPRAAWLSARIYKDENENKGTQ